MKGRLLFILAASACALAILAAGCGGGGGGGGERLSKAEFIQKADAICADANKNLPDPPSDLANVDPTSSTATDEQLDKFGSFVEDGVKVLRNQVDDLRKLKPPADFDDDYAKALSLLDEANNELGEAAEAAHNADRDKLKEKLDESDRHGNDATKIGKDYGLKVCGT